MRPRLLLYLWLSLILWPRLGSAPELPVIDAQNLFVNTVSMVQNIAMVANMVIELTPLEASVVDGMESDLQSIMHLITTATALMPFNTTQTRQFFDVLYPTGARLPCTPVDYEQWEATALTQQRLALSDSMTAQGLLAEDSMGLTVRRVVQTLSRILQTIGNLQGSQQLQQQFVLSQAEQIRASTIAGQFYRAADSRDAFQVTQAAAYRCMHRKAVETW